MVNALCTRMVKFWLMLWLWVSVKVMRVVTGVGCGGVPLKTPLGLSDSHTGRPAAVQVYVPLPPEAASVCGDGNPTDAAGSDAVPNDSTAFPGSVKYCVSV